MYKQALFVQKTELPVNADMMMEGVRMGPFPEQDASVLSVNTETKLKKGKLKQSQQRLPASSTESRNERRHTSLALREHTFTEHAVNGALSICQSSLGD